MQLIIIPLFNPNLFCYFEIGNSGAENLALGNSNIAAWSNVYALFYNPAGIQKTESITISSTLHNYYSIPEINRFTTVSTFSLYSNKISIGIDSFGNNLYRENRTLIGWAVSIKSQIKMGLKLGYDSLVIKNYGNDSSFSLSIGFLYKIDSSISLGVILSDFYQFGLGKNLDYNNSYFSIGGALIPIPDFKLFFAISREVSFPVEYKFGFEYSLKQCFVARIGYEEGFETISFGFGTKFILVKLDYALRWHNWLGASHVISFGLDI